MGNMKTFTVALVKEAIELTPDKYPLEKHLNLIDSTSELAVMYTNSYRRAYQNYRKVTPEEVNTFASKFMQGTQFEVTSVNHEESIEQGIENPFKYAEYIPMADGRKFYVIEVSPPVVKEQQFPQILAEDKSTQKKIVILKDRVAKLEIAAIDGKEERELLKNEIKILK